MSSRLQRRSEKPKVFGIGFHKTGTSSLGEALEILGYRVAGPFGVHDPKIGETALRRALQLVPEYEAFQDNPWPILFRELDTRFPGSRFILTIRETEAWLRSITRHFGGRETPMREWIYGVANPRGAEDRYVATFERHNADVRAHFADRPDDLLVLDLPGGAGWEELCAFLDVDVPRGPFPHSNRAEDREGI